MYERESDMTLDRRAEELQAANPLFRTATESVAVEYTEGGAGENTLKELTDDLTHSGTMVYIAYAAWARLTEEQKVEVIKEVADNMNEYATGWQSDMEHADYWAFGDPR